ncbi:MAG: tRNA (adenosine(37)-N6)-dimethylallyltransferase MiaA [Anaerolineaceae bacterium]|nr:tRNA (adenosine(37)-N6)-dimethylallyltransferase MiaA [Anaerolineaceae bacterium]
MQLPEISKPLIILVGPTAVGKTSFSIELAKSMNAEIISADSRYLYRGMDIGTAKPDLQEMGGITHYLIDVADPDEIWSLTDYQKCVHDLVENIYSRNKIPLLVGGTGQYIRSIIEGWEPPEREPDQNLRIVLERWAHEIGKVELHKRLEYLDPIAASKIDTNNLRRTIRALEVIFITGKKFSCQRRKTTIPYTVFLIGMQRERGELYERIDLRIEEMFQMGLLDEVKGLIRKGYSSDLPTFSAIGYREAIAIIKGEMEIEEAIIQMKRLTRNFVRRQANWFKKDDPRINWFDAADITVEDVCKHLKDLNKWIFPNAE